MDNPNFQGRSFTKFRMATHWREADVIIGIAVGTVGNPDAASSARILAANRADFRSRVGSFLHIRSWNRDHNFAHLLV
jgi:hypothetical protein